MHSAKILLSLAALAGTSVSQKSDSEFCSAFFTSLVSIIATEAPTTPPAILSFLAQSTATISPTTTTTAAPLTTLDFASHAQELCAIATELPPSLLPDFKTYASSLLSFGIHRSSEHIAYATDCSPEDEVASRSSYLAYIFTATGNFCDHTATPAPGSGSGSGSGTSVTATTTTAFATQTPAATGSYPASSAGTGAVVTAAAARPTGAYLGAAAMGGILGAAAML